MALHRLARLTIGVPDVDATAAFYRDFGLTETGTGRFSTADGGDQLVLAQAPKRRLVELVVACDDADDLGRIRSDLAGLGVDATIDADRLETREPVTGTQVGVEVLRRLEQDPAPPAPFNAPGHVERVNARARGAVDRHEIHPRKLGHCVLGVPDFESVRGFFVDGLGFKVSDHVDGVGTFMRCSEEHHNLFVQRAPVTFLHHTSWQVNGVDEIGAKAAALLAQDPSRHGWGLGRHCVGSNFFWYLRDPAGNFAELYSDMDVIVDDELWEPDVWTGTDTLAAWGPPVPPEWLVPADLAELMAG